MSDKQIRYRTVNIMIVLAACLFGWWEQSWLAVAVGYVALALCGAAAAAIDVYYERNFGKGKGGVN